MLLSRAMACSKNLRLNSMMITATIQQEAAMQEVTQAEDPVNLQKACMSLSKKTSCICLAALQTHTQLYAKWVFAYIRTRRCQSSHFGNNQPMQQQECYAPSRVPRKGGKARCLNHQQEASKPCNLALAGPSTPQKHARHCQQLAPAATEKRAVVELRHQPA